MKKQSILKIIFFTLLISFSTFNTKAQNEWFPEGATWYYGCMSFAMEGYQKLYYHKDTIIKGYDFKTFATQHVIYDHISGLTNSFLNEDAYFLRADSNIVYWYHQNLDTIYALYNFNLSVGDTVIIPPDPQATANTVINYGSYSIAQVDSIDYIVINGDSLKRLFFKYNGNYHCYSSYTGPYCMPSPIIEKVGALAWLFPFSTYIIDNYPCGGLRCYEDINFPLYSFTPSTPCDFTVGLNTLRGFSEIHIAPNPANQFIDILGLKHNNLNVQIFDILGRLVIEKTVNEHNNRIFIEDLPDGVNFLKVEHGNTFYVKKFLKY